MDSSFAILAKEHRGSKDLGYMSEHNSSILKPQHSGVNEQGNLTMSKFAEFLKTTALGGLSTRALVVSAPRRGGEILPL